jgi:4-amino-4-deoxy-L-arabinose transferase-like glycosyltransferase
MLINISYVAVLFANVVVLLTFFLSTKYTKLSFEINCVSTLLLWFFLLGKINILRTVNKHKTDIILAVALLLTAFFVYFYKIEVVTPGMWGDEITVASTGEKIFENWNSISFVNAATGYTKPFLFLEGAFIKTFGRNLTSIRLLSMLFGVAANICFFFFLRLFFKRLISFTASILMIFSYPSLVISRLAYNITAALTFQILTFIFIYQYHKKQKNIYLLGLGLSLGTGLFTYAGFRTFTLAALIVTALTVLNQKQNLKSKFSKLLLTGSFLFIAASSFIGFSLRQPEVAMARVKSLSVFGQNLPASEIIKEIRGATLRLTHIFLSSGDPSARSNPSGVSMFDILTGLVLIVGLIYLFKNKRKIFWVSLFFIIPFIINDIFSLERIPEFHYYGIGHPNTYRLSGIIPIFYFWVAWGFKVINKSLTGAKSYISYIQTLLVFFIVFVNTNRYFNQAKVNQGFFQYNYIFNGVASIKAADFIKNSGLNKVKLTKSFASDPRINYFSGEKVKFDIFNPESETQALSIIQSEELTLIDPKDNPELSKKLVSDWQENPTLYFLKIVKNPFGDVDFLVLSKTE